MLRRIRQLSWSERRDLWSAFWRLVIVRLSLLTGGIGKTLERCGGLESGLQASLDEAELARWRRRALAFKRVGRFIPKVRCLARSLALRWWMRSQGLHAQIVIGVRKADNAIHSHSWVVVDNKPIDEHEDVVALHRVMQTDTATTASGSIPEPS